MAERWWRMRGAEVVGWDRWQWVVVPEGSGGSGEKTGVGMEK